ncbi:hypothetical protein BB561_006856 [Smittium simulii]|uniref:Uncharacterized protein n=1 Tax=Smittium simulii TaxID=133385 RepID=A0A2T9Y105_9FUNG|nr:hypothetical protein BB561_006856 [Smittium simulii]
MAIEKPIVKGVIYTATATKQKRVSEIINQDYSNSIPEIREQQYQPTNHVTNAPSIILANSLPKNIERILNQPLLVTVREYMDARPNLAPIIIKSFQQIIKTKKSPRLDFSASEEKPLDQDTTLTYILAKISRQPVPVFIYNKAIH